jgi:hypothetical protein
MRIFATEFDNLTRALLMMKTISVLLFIKVVGPPHALILQNTSGHGYFKDDAQP